MHKLTDGDYCRLSGLFEKLRETYKEIDGEFFFNRAEEIGMTKILMGVSLILATRSRNREFQIEDGKVLIYDKWYKIPTEKDIGKKVKVGLNYLHILSGEVKVLEDCNIYSSRRFMVKYNNMSPPERYYDCAILVEE